FPWAGRNYETLWKRSPVAHVAQVSTPTLLLHGESDNDVHITQAEEMYTALRQRGLEAVLVRYPREGPWLSRAEAPAGCCHADRRMVQPIPVVRAQTGESARSFCTASITRAAT